MIKTLRILSVIVTISLLAISPLSAQTASETKAEKKDPGAPENRPHFSPVMPVKIKPRAGGADSISKAAADVEKVAALNPDSMGLYSTPSQGSLGGNVWQNYSDVELSSDLSNLNINIASPVLQHLDKHRLYQPV